MRSLSLRLFRHPYAPLVGALAIASFFLFFRLGHADFTGDDAYYSVRSIGLLDYMFVDLQSTPIQWFDRVPWWGMLSFHDHPLLLFLISHLFFSLFGVSAFVAKLPSALMALGAIALSYAWMRRFLDERAAGFGALFLALNPDIIWAGRTAVLDAGVVCATAFSLLAFWLFLGDRRWWWLWGISAGLVLEAKWTTLFLFPAYACILAFFYPERLRDRKTWYAVGLACLLALPAIVYNGAMIASRGHASLQIARLFGGAHPWQTSRASFDALAPLGIFGVMSLPLAFAAIGAAAFAIVKRRRPAVCILASFLVFQTMVIGLHSPLFAILFAPLVAEAGIFFFRWCQTRFRFRGFGALPSALLAVYLIAYIVNSFFLTKPFGATPWWRMARDTSNYGGDQLDRYLGDFLRAAQIDRLDSYRFLKVKQSHLARYFDPAYTPRARPGDVKNVVIFDDTLHWSPRIWLFERRIFYENAALFPLSLVPFLHHLGMAPEAVYYIHATSAALLDSGKVGERAAGRNREERVAHASGPPVEIRRRDGAVAFRVYRTTFADLLR